MCTPLIAVLALGLVGCSSPQREPPAGRDTAPPPEPVRTDRAPLVPADHPMHARVEGTSFNNACQGDGDCHVGGCSAEICSGEQGASSTCEMPADGWPTTGGTCGCVDGQCQWYRAPGGAAPQTDPRTGQPATGALPAQGEKCTEAGKCAAGLSCLSYHGIAGAQGPRFTSCEIACAGKGARCPDGQRCTTIADGPGQVCRP